MRVNDNRALYEAWVEAREKVDQIRAKYLPEGVVLPEGYEELQAAIDMEQAAFRLWRESAGV